MIRLAATSLKARSLLTKITPGKTYGSDFISSVHTLTPAIVLARFLSPRPLRLR